MLHEEIDFHEEDKKDLYTHTQNRALTMLHEEDEKELHTHTYTYTHTHTHTSINHAP